MSETPRGWELLKLRDVATLKTGPFGSALHKADYTIGGIPLINPTHIREGKLFPASEVSVSSETAQCLTEYRLNEGDIVMGRRGEMGRCAVVPRYAQNWLCGTGSVVVKSTSATHPQYLQRFLTAPATVAALIGDSVGSTMINLNQGVLLGLDIPLAPLPEQKRIADKLDSVLARVDACRDRLDRLPALLKRFRQSILAAATSGQLTEDWRKYKNTLGQWKDLCLGDIADIQGGITKDSKKQSITDEELPYLRVANVQRGYLVLNEMKTIRIPANKLAGLLLEHGDILFNEGGDLDKLGRGWIWEGKIQRCSFQNHVFRARLLDRANQPKYISWWGNSRGLDYFTSSGKQTTNLASINKTMLSNLPISLPPPAEQTEIVRRVEILFAFADRLEARLAAARRQVGQLTPALLAKAFRGELVAQDPADEPAAELLKRLAAQRAAAPVGKRSRAGVPGAR